MLKNLPSYIFRQIRIGKDGKPFLMFKFRTMYLGAEKDRGKIEHLNEADGPVFKIRDDPRFTKIGRWLARTGLDELPQVINILKGEMAVVGPRPLPLEEEKKIPNDWKTIRRSVKPGITSSWVVKGGHNLKFREWMELDMEDIKRKSFWCDAGIILQTIGMVVINVVNMAFTAGIDKLYLNNYHFTKRHK